MIGMLVLATSASEPRVFRLKQMDRGHLDIDDGNSPRGRQVADGINREDCDNGQGL